MNEKKRIDFIQPNADQTIESRGRDQFLDRISITYLKKHGNHTARFLIRDVEKFSKMKLEVQ